MQMQSNILRTTVIRPTITETTALGAAFLTGLAVGFWSNPSSIQDLWKSDKVFEPHENENRFQDMYAGWQKAVSTTLFQAGSGHT
jgi:glycerol kinase